MRTKKSEKVLEFCERYHWLIGIGGVWGICIQKGREGKGWNEIISPNTFKILGRLLRIALSVTFDADDFWKELQYEEWLPVSYDL
jgi:hypothetical protein